MPQSATSEPNSSRPLFPFGPRGGAGVVRMASQAGAVVALKTAHFPIVIRSLHSTAAAFGTHG